MSYSFQILLLENWEKPSKSHTNSFKSSATGRLRKNKVILLTRQSPFCQCIFLTTAMSIKTEDVNYWGIKFHYSQWGHALLLAADIRPHFYAFHWISLFSYFCFSSVYPSSISASWLHCIYGKKKKILLPAGNQNYFHQYLFSRKALKMLISDFYCNSALGCCEVQPQRMRRPNSRCEYCSIGRHFYIYDRIKLNCVLPVFDWVSEVRGNHRLLILAWHRCTWVWGIGRPTLLLMLLAST